VIDRKAVIVGAGGGIGAAVAQALEAQGYDAIHTVSRSDPGEGSAHVTHWTSDYSDTSIARIGAAISGAPGRLERLVICNGVLQGDGFRPERALRQLDSDVTSQIFHANATIPMLWLGAFTDAIRGAEAPRVAVLSARVGSIEDNRLGGWYSYRASKAALNMMLRCASVEFTRINKRAQILAFHPGTVDTDLSRPFQRGVPEGKLFTPEFVASRLVTLLDGLGPSGELKYLDWDGQAIPF